MPNVTSTINGPASRLMMYSYGQHLSNLATGFHIETTCSVAMGVKCVLAVIAPKAGTYTLKGLLLLLVLFFSFHYDNWQWGVIIMQADTVSQMIQSQRQFIIPRHPYQLPLFVSVSFL